jgi:membrane protease YdiL (CAAX protease family)
VTVPTVASRLGDRAAIGATLGALAAYVVTRRTAIPDDWHLPANLGATAAVAGVAWAAGMGASELGLARARVAEGLRWGGGAAATVAAVIGAGVAVPSTQDWFADDRLDVGLGGMLGRVLVEIPLGTVALEELAFRGVLLGLLLRVSSPVGALVGSTVPFALWHLPSLLGSGADAAAGSEVTGSTGAVVAGTLAGTAAAGAAFAWLRLRSGSLVAPALAHWAVNGLTFALAWWAVGDAG